METRPRRQIVLTHWNAGVFHRSALPNLLPELAIYALLYDEVLIREEDLLTNRQAIHFLRDPEQFRIFEEFLTLGLVKLLRMPIDEYPQGRRFDPVRLPVSARAEEHELRRSYKGGPWKPTEPERHFFARLDGLVAQHPNASRFHVPFPPGNPFAAELAELLEHRNLYRLSAYPVFRYIDPKTADAFVEFCRVPEAWQRFLRNSGIESVIDGPDGGFYRTAAYQCFHLLPTPRSMQRLVESVYAAAYCDRERSDGRYGGSQLIELPDRYSSDEERAEAAETIVKVELVPTAATASIPMVPGIAAAIARTRESVAFDSLQQTLDLVGAGGSDTSLPGETTFREAWYAVCAEYSQHSAPILAGNSVRDKQIPRYGVFAWVLARVLGFVILPHGPLQTDIPVLADAALISAIEHRGPHLLRAFRSMLKMPKAHEMLESSVSVRCSRVSLNAGKGA